MTLWTAPRIAGGMDQKQIENLLARVIKDVAFIMNGNIDWKNIRAHSIQADRMTVEELSAISANLGHITAGLIEAVQIFGSYIATANGTYPRVEFSSSENLLKALSEVDNLIRITALEIGNSPALAFSNNGLTVLFYNDGENINVLTASLNINIGTTSGTVFLRAGTNINFSDWDSIYNNSTGKTLQQDLDSKPDKGIGSSVVYVSNTPGGPADTPMYIDNGVVTSIG